MRVLGICGSLRAGSYNGLLLAAACELAPAGMTIHTGSIAEIPLYNEDIRSAGLPEGVVALKKDVAAADAVLIVSPEYNYSVPGVLKNTLDWMSRGPELPFEGKPVAIMGASTGIFGTARGQYHLRQVLQFMNTFTLNKPEVFLGQANLKFDEHGQLKDDVAKQLISKQLEALRDLCQRLGPAL